ncbi:MAG: phosphotransferase [Chlamydiota bacterium]
MSYIQKGGNCSSKELNRMKGLNWKVSNRQRKTREEYACSDFWSTWTRIRELNTQDSIGNFDGEFTFLDYDKVTLEGARLHAKKHLGIKAGECLQKAMVTDSLHHYDTGDGGFGVTEGASVRRVLMPAMTRSEGTLHFDITGKYSSLGSFVSCVDDGAIIAGEVNEKSLYSEFVSSRSRGAFSHSVKRDVDVMQGGAFSEKGNFDVRSRIGDIHWEGIFGTGKDGTMRSARELGIVSNHQTVHNESSGFSFTPTSMTWSTSEWSTTRATVPLFCIGRNLNLEARSRLHLRGIQADVDGEVTTQFDQRLVEPHQHTNYFSRDGVSLSVSASAGLVTTDAIESAVSGGDVGMTLANRIPLVKVFSDMSQAQGAGIPIQMASSFAKLRQFAKKPTDFTNPSVSVRLGAFSEQSEWTESFLPYFKVGGDVTNEGDYSRNIGLEYDVEGEVIDRGTTVIYEDQADRSSYERIDAGVSVSFSAVGVTASADFSLNGSDSTRYRPWRVSARGGHTIVALNRSLIHQEDTDESYGFSISGNTWSSDKDADIGVTNLGVQTTGMRFNADIDAMRRVFTPKVRAEELKTRERKVPIVTVEPVEAPQDEINLGLPLENSAPTLLDELQIAREREVALYNHRLNVSADQEKEPWYVSANKSNMRDAFERNRAGVQAAKLAIDGLGKAVSGIGYVAKKSYEVSKPLLDLAFRDEIKLVEMSGAAVRSTGRAIAKGAKFTCHLHPSLERSCQTVVDAYDRSRQWVGDTYQSLKSTANNPQALPALLEHELGIPREEGVSYAHDSMEVSSFIAEIAAINKALSVGGRVYRNFKASRNPSNLSDWQHAFGPSFFRDGRQFNTPLEQLLRPWEGPSAEQMMQMKNIAPKKIVHRLPGPVKLKSLPAPSSSGGTVKKLPPPKKNKALPSPLPSTKKGGTPVSTKPSYTPNGIKGLNLPSYERDARKIVGDGVLRIDPEDPRPKLLWSITNKEMDHNGHFGFDYRENERILQEFNKIFDLQVKSISGMEDVYSVLKQVPERTFSNVIIGGHGHRMTVGLETPWNGEFADAVALRGLAERISMTIHSCSAGASDGTGPLMELKKSFDGLGQRGILAAPREDSGLGAFNFSYSGGLLRAGFSKPTNILDSSSSFIDSTHRVVTEPELRHRMHRVRSEFANNGQIHPFETNDLNPSQAADFNLLVNELQKSSRIPKERPTASSIQPTNLKISNKHAKTLGVIFQNPPSSNIDWVKVENLMKHLSAEVSEGAGSRVSFKIKNRQVHIHRPHEKQVSKGRLKEIRTFLNSVGIVPSKVNKSPASHSINMSNKASSNRIEKKIVSSVVRSATNVPKRSKSNSSEIDVARVMNGSIIPVINESEASRSIETFLQGYWGKSEYRVMKPKEGTKLGHSHNDVHMIQQVGGEPVAVVKDFQATRSTTRGFIPDIVATSQIQRRNLEHSIVPDILTVGRYTSGDGSERGLTMYEYIAGPTAEEMMSDYRDFPAEKIGGAVGELNAAGRDLPVSREYLETLIETFNLVAGSAIKQLRRLGLPLKFSEKDMRMIAYNLRQNPGKAAFVHGDLHNANIIVSDRGIAIIDPGSYMESVNQLGVPHGMAAIDRFSMIVSIRATAAENGWSTVETEGVISDFLKGYSRFESVENTPSSRFAEAYWEMFLLNNLVYKGTDSHLLETTLERLNANFGRNIPKSAPSTNSSVSTQNEGGLSFINETHPLFNIHQEFNKQSNNKWIHYSGIGRGIVKGGSISAVCREIDGKSTACFRFSITQPAREKLQKWLSESSKSKREKVRVSEEDYYFNGKGSVGEFHPLWNRKLETKANIIEFDGLGRIVVGQDPEWRTLYNRVTVELHDFNGSGVASKNMYQMFSTIGLEEALLVNRSEDESRIKMMQLFKAHFPAKSYQFSVSSKTYNSSISDLKMQIMQVESKMFGIFNKYLLKQPNLMPRIEIDKGRFVWGIGDLSSQMREQGAWGLQHGIKDNDQLPEILINGLESSVERFDHSKWIDGQSTLSDLKQGSGDQVFMRLVTKKNVNIWSADDIRINVLIDLNVVNRGGYAYLKDEHGTKDPSIYPKRPNWIEFVKNAGHESEVMSKHRIGPECIRGIVVLNQKVKAEIIENLRTYERFSVQKIIQSTPKGEHILGKPIDEFIHVWGAFKKEMWN